MKKLSIILMVTLLFSVGAFGQVFDGYTQPKNYRIISVMNNQGFRMLHLSRRVDLSNKWSVTLVARGYQLDEKYAGQVWNNFTLLNNKLGILHRARYNITDDYFFQDLNATYQFADNWMVDASCYKFHSTNDMDIHFQSDIGFKIGDVAVFNTGYMFTNTKQMFSNLRLRFLDSWQWLQIKYEYKTERVTVATFVHFNKLGW